MSYTEEGIGGYRVKKKTGLKAFLDIIVLLQGYWWQDRGKKNWCEGELGSRTCIWDQKVHDFNSVKVDHHTATMKERWTEKSPISSEIQCDLFSDGRCVIWPKMERKVYGSREGTSDHQSRDHWGL